MLELLMVLGSPREGWWQVGRLNYNRVVRVGWEPEGAAGGEGGAAHSLEWDHVDAVWSWLEIDQVKWSSQGQGRRAGAVDLEGRSSLLLLLVLVSLASSSLSEPEGRTARTSSWLGNYRGAAGYHLVHRGEGQGGERGLPALLLLHQLLHTGSLGLLSGDFLLSSSSSSSSSLPSLRPGHFTGVRLGFLCGSHSFTSFTKDMIQNTGYGWGSLKINQSKTKKHKM